MPGTIIDTAAAVNFAYTDTAPAETVTIEDGPPESGFQTTEITSNAIGAEIFANKTNVTFSGDGQGDNVILDNPDPATGMASLTITDLGGTGSITGSNPAANGPDIAVATLDLIAPGNIGSAARALQTQVGTLSATASGILNIANGVAAPVTLSIAGGIVEALGALTLTNNGTIDSLTNNSIIEGASNVTVKAQGINADLNLGGQTSLASIDGFGAGDVVDVEAGQDMNLGNSAGYGAIESAGSIKLVAGRNLIIDANAIVFVDVGTGGITASAGGDFLMLPAPGTLSDAPYFETEGGAIALSAGAGHLMTLASTGTNAVSSNGGNITLTADDMAIAAGVTAAGATTGNVLIQPASAGQTIGLGSGMGGLELTAAALNEVTATTLTIGNAAAGSVSVGGTVDPAHVTNLTIDSAGGFTMTSGSFLEVAGTITINIGMSGVGATANLQAGGFSATALDVIGGAGNDLFLPNANNVTTFTGGGGQDTFEGASFDLLDDTITDLSSGDKIVVTDGNIANFTFKLTGTTLQYSVDGGAIEDFLTLSNAPVGHFAETADPVSGVDLTFVGPPKAVQNGLLLVSPEGESVLTSNLLQYSNAVSSPSQLTYNIVSGPQDGTLLLNGAPTTSFTQAEINSGDLFYEETGPYSATDAFTFTVADNMGDTSAVQTFNIHIAPARIAFQDFNGDGMPDLLYINPTTGDTGYNDGPNTPFHDLGDGPTSYQIVGTGDFAGGATPYILYDNPNSGDIGYNQGPNTTFHDLGVAPTSYQVVGVGDFSGQGTTDILWHDNTTGDIGWNDGPMTPWHDLGAAPASYQVVAIADLNNDGTTDIVWENSTSGDIGWNDGPNTPWHDLGTAPTTYQVVGTANFSSDGLPDLVFENPTSGDIGWNEGPSSPWHDLGTAPTSYDVVGIANLTGNGNVDIVYQNPTSGDIGWNQGPNTPFHDLGTASIAYKPIGI